MLKLVLRHRLKVALVLLALVAAVVVAVLWGPNVGMADLLRAKDEVLGWLRDTPAAVVTVAIAVLPLAGFPISPLLILAGLAYGGPVGMLIGVAGVALNNALGYGIAAWLREPVRRWLERRGMRVPVVQRGDYVKVVLLFRLTPGVPAFLQNYVLGLSGIPFWTFFWVSLPPQLVTVAGFVLTGGALFEGEWGVIVLGVSLLIVFGIVGRLIHSHRKKKELTDAAADTDAP
ncbi:VTT domain-containing protein [Ruficoccus amylovorans]|uniref:TVP38/TMEM64 family membrane protein n=1 Tax=Ruficoccus amylovorans TaxID=1804625 RepID=A0A842HEU9_9BACT|nr:VTT domain-containing protein [Ruficoccus amylovorans]MBC2595125.1 VTT domain-containing protein [Ruficoccus amylovorans]